MTWLYLVLGGALGTTLRYYGSTAVADATGSPAAGTFAINVLGSFAIGFLLVLGTQRYHWSPDAIVFVGAGLLGGFTTFSAFTWQTLQQFERGAVGAGIANVALSIACGLLAVWAGASTARAVS